MVKVVAYCALHYGADYLGYAVRSVIDHVDEMWFLYSAIGSHGHRTDVKCPDTEEQLFEIAKNASGDKFRWVKSEWPHEGAQRDSIFEYAPDADVILVVDADEIWSEHLIRKSLFYADTGHKTIRVPMVHFWRSFWKGILRDPAYPIRMINRRMGAVSSDFTLPQDGHFISHLGYAQRPEIVNYKQLTHGHKGEWRKDIDWFNERFMNPDAVTDLHPVGSEYWSIETVNPLDYMPPFMATHPYFDKDVID